MKSKFRPRRVIAAASFSGIVAAAVAMILTTAGAFSATAAQYQYGPQLTKQPVIAGTAQVGQKLTTSAGSWNSAAPLTFSYVWVRCDANGNNCSDIPNAKSSVYTLTSADAGHRLRSHVYATSSQGSTMAYSDPSAVVQSSSGGTTPTTSGGTIAAANVKLPNRLVIDKVKYSQNPIKTRTGTQAQFHVSDASGHSVSGALVYVLGVPYSRIRAVPEAITNASGWATVQLVPDRAFPRKGYLVMFVRARVQGQDLLGGTSTRRLVQVTIAPPAS